MIDEALKYQAEGKYEVVVKIMMDLHRKFNQPPESQNEIYFYQKYGMLIREAESYLLQFIKIRWLWSRLATSTFNFSATSKKL